LRGTGKLSYREFGKRMAYYHFIMPMFIQFISSGFKWDEDRQLIAALIGQLNTVIIFGDIIQMAATEIVGAQPERWKSASIPLADVVKEMYVGVSDVLQAAFRGDTGVEEMLEAFVELGGATGKFIGQPVDQVANIMGGINDVVEGDVEKGLKRIYGFSEKVAEDSSGGGGNSPW